MSMVHFVHAAVAAGLVATVLFDLWQRLLRAATGIPPTNWGLIGRWFAHMPRGRFMHEAIAEAAPVENEAAIGWVMHYLIGQIYGFVYLSVAVALPAGEPTALNGLLFGAASVVIPWFMMQPALGLGVMGAKAANPAIPRYTALAGHSLYGLGLYAGAALYGLAAA